MKDPLYKDSWEYPTYLNPTVEPLSSSQRQDGHEVEAVVIHHNGEVP